MTEKDGGDLNLEHFLPADIERTSMEIISRELDRLGYVVLQEEAYVVKRVIHTTADFEYAANLHISPGAVSMGKQALQQGIPIVTDTNMIRAGLSKGALEKLGSQAVCFMAEEEVALAAKQNQTTRAVAAMDKAAREFPQSILAVGNAPTALLRICEQIQKGLRPALVIGAPVGFVNVVESKERLLEICSEYQVPVIVAKGRKGGSTVAAAICNALIYAAAGQLDPADRV